MMLKLLVAALLASPASGLLPSRGVAAAGRRGGARPRHVLASPPPSLSSTAAAAAAGGGERSAGDDEPELLSELLSELDELPVFVCANAAGEPLQYEVRARDSQHSEGRRRRIALVCVARARVSSRARSPRSCGYRPFSGFRGFIL